MIQKLLIALEKAEKISVNLKNEIKEIVYTLHQTKRITKTICSIII